MKQFDLAVHCGELLSMAGGLTATKKNQLIGVEGSKITHIGPFEGKDKFTAKKFIDASSHVVMPGLINGHTHMAMNLLRGLAEDLPFHDWLEKAIFPVEAKLVSPEFVETGVEMAAWESMLAGTTTVTDMFYYMDSAASVFDRIGMRALVGESVADYPAPDNKEQKGNDWKILDRLVEKYKGHDRVLPMIAPHAPYTCSDETLKKARDYAVKHGIFFKIHVSETRKEYDDSLKKHGLTPVAHMDKLGITEIPSLFAHCVHLDDKDIDILAKKKASVVHNPASNMKLGSGTCPLDKLHAKKVRLALGTDSAASNNSLTLFQEMKLAALQQKLVNHDNTLMTASHALNMVTLGAAKAIGLDKEIGSLEVGKRADLIAIDLTQPHFLPGGETTSYLVYASRGSEVSHVVIHGKQVVENGKALTIDTEGVRAKVRKIKEQINEIV